MKAVHEIYRFRGSRGWDGGGAVKREKGRDCQSEWESVTCFTRQPSDDKMMDEVGCYDTMSYIDVMMYGFGMFFGLR